MIDIDHAPIRPGLLNLLAVMPHDIRVAGNMARLEGRSHQLALATVKIALAAKDAVADDRAKDFVDGQALIEIVSVFDQNALNMLRPVEENNGKWPKAQRGDIARTRHAEQKVEAVPGKFGQIPDKQGAAPYVAQSPRS